MFLESFPIIFSDQMSHPVTITRKAFLSELSLFRTAHEKRLESSIDSSTKLFVWIQGMVFRVYPTDNYFLIDDCTSACKVQIPKNGSIPMPEVGQYVMVRGAVFQKEGPIFLYGVQINEFNYPNAESIWILEVIDSQQFEHP